MSSRLYTWLASGLTAAMLVSCGGTRSGVPTTEQPPQTAAQTTEETTATTVIASFGAAEQLTDGDYDNGLASVNSDGSRIVYQSNRDGHWQVYELNLADKSENHLIVSEANDENPTWGADDAYVLFVSDRDGAGNEWERDIYSYEIASGATTRLTTSPGDDWYPASANAAGFLFLSERDADASQAELERTHSVYRDSFSDGTQVALSALPGNSSSPLELGDGRLLVRTNDAALAIASQDNSQLEQLTADTLHCGTADYNTARGWVVFTALFEGNYSLYLFDLGDRKIQPISVSGEDVRFPKFAPDGAAVFYTARINGKFQIFRLPQF